MAGAHGAREAEKLLTRKGEQLGAQEAVVKFSGVLHRPSFLQLAGDLFLTNSRILYLPNRFERLLGEKKVNWPFHLIDQFGMIRDVKKGLIGRGNVLFFECFFVQRELDRHLFTTGASSTDLKWVESIADQSGRPAVPRLDVSKLKNWKAT